MIPAVNQFLDDLRGGRMSEAPVVQVEQGKLQGKIVNSVSGRAFYSFQGIPFAKPPLGSLRFKAPQPPEPWEGVRDATTEGNVCAQVDSLFTKQYRGDENCLFLNIHTPNLDGEFLPVMLYIHGGRYKLGSGSPKFCGPDYLVEKDVVLVTVNYRCGPLGFLSLNTPEVPGNAGLKDVVQAIRWVKQNIHNFGGNSGNITIFGASCGSAMVSVLTASPLTKNLVNKAIMQSGTALCCWAWQKQPVEKARNLAKTLGCESEDVDEILEFLSSTPVRELVEASEKLADRSDFFEKGNVIFAPVIEKEFVGVEAVITESFVDLLTSGRMAEIPVMIGSTGLEFVSEHRTEDLQVFIPESFNIERNTQESVAIAEKIKAVYFKGSHTSVESLTEYYQLLSDVMINVDTHRYVQLLVQASPKPVYFYKFNYAGELNITKKLHASLGLNRAGHTDELGYLFKMEMLNDVEPTPQDVKMRERMLRLWTNFAKSGNPTPEENHYITVTWLPVTKDNLYYLSLNSELALGTSPDKEKMEFWDDLYSKYFKIWEHPKINTDEAPRKVEITVTAPEVPEAPETPEKSESPEAKAPENPEPEVTETQSVVVETLIETLVETNQVSESADGKNSQIKEESFFDRVEKEDSPVKETFIDRVEKEVTPVKDVVDAAPVEKASPVEATKVDKIEQNGEKEVNGTDQEKQEVHSDVVRKPRPSNEIKMVQQSNGAPKDVIRANDPPEDDLPKNIGVNKFVHFFESLGGKK